MRLQYEKILITPTAGLQGVTDDRAKISELQRALSQVLHQHTKPHHCAWSRTCRLLTHHRAKRRRGRHPLPPSRFRSLSRCLFRSLSRSLFIALSLALYVLHSCVRPRARRTPPSVCAQPPEWRARLPAGRFSLPHPPPSPLSGGVQVRDEAADERSNNIFREVNPEP